ncbi:MAG: hypothetical protein AOA66_0643 [Candidatus Bathyarchaeota archaeon BA2]|nr:MAG: hypothetical protein AOA66_0643 [Candidatus Bathyarchaeota archaeon BA2]
MKRKHGSSIFRRNPKEEIINRARKRVFNRNPLLATSHQVVCKACGSTQKITYLDYLKSGRFELGKTQMIEVSYAAPTIFALSHTMERITPLIVTVRCERCGTEITCSPVSVEYLLFTATKQEKMRNAYV